MSSTLEAVSRAMTNASVLATYLLQLGSDFKVGFQALSTSSNTLTIVPIAPKLRIVKRPEGKVDDDIS